MKKILFGLIALASVANAGDVCTISMEQTLDVVCTRTEDSETVQLVRGGEVNAIRRSQAKSKVEAIKRLLEKSYHLEGDTFIKD